MLPKGPALTDPYHNHGGGLSSIEKESRVSRKTFLYFPMDYYRKETILGYLHIAGLYAWVEHTPTKLPIFWTGTPHLGNLNLMRGVVTLSEADRSEGFITTREMST